MTYRELLELYKAGELELEQRKRIEKDIEKQEAISDYLYEQEGIPGLEDVFKEEQNSSVFADGRQTETGKELSLIHILSSTAGFLWQEKVSLMQIIRHRCILERQKKC